MKLNLPAETVGLQLFKINKRDEAIACEAVRFVEGRSAVDTVLRRAAISGRVELGGTIQDHFADVLDTDQTIIETVALDAASYRALKNKWMKCRIEKD